jgi:hypothetical protein
MNALTGSVNGKEATKLNYLPIFAQDPLSTAKVAGLLQHSEYQEILEEKQAQPRLDYRVLGDEQDGDAPD